MKINFKTFFITLTFLACFSSSILAQDTTDTSIQKERVGQYFIDLDGDGYNDNAPDHDGDGIPNGLDPDWQKLEKGKRGNRFVDLDGDGINDNLQTFESHKGLGGNHLDKGGSSLEAKGKKQMGQGQKKHGNKR